MWIDTFSTFRGVLVAISLIMLSACVTTDTRIAPSVAADILVRRYVLDYAHVPPAPGDLASDIQPVWAALRAGDRIEARQVLDLATPASRDTAGANTAEGLLLLASGATAEAYSCFQLAVAQSPDYPIALYGLGFLAETQGDRAAGFNWYRQAVNADPSLSAAAVRLQVLELEQAQELVAQGEQEEAAGATPAALIAYESALQLGPNILEPYLRIAEIQRHSSNLDSAVRTLRLARDRIGELHVILEPLGRALQDNGEYGDAYGVFQALEDVAPGDPKVRTLVEVAGELYFTSDLPAEYRSLEQKPMIVREDLAALIAIQLEDLRESVSEPLSGVIMIDIDDSWAQDYIREVVAWRIMEPFQNHAFRTDLEVSRMMFAEVVYRILELINATDGVHPVNPTDVSSVHYLYERILVVVGQDILRLGPRNTFGLLEPVSGREATAAIQRLVRLARSSGD
jgi:tetratricopeptide (TPR) repeat protein